jgi:predicted Zn-dependent protease
MLWGDDPEQGFVNGRTFAHPKLKIAFDAPQGFTLNNTSRAVIIGGPNGARAQFGSAQIPAGGLDEYAAALLRSVLGQAPARVGQLQRTTTNGLETVILPAQAQAQSGQVAEVTSVVYRVAGVGYHFVTIAPAGGSQVMGPMVRSMRALSDAEAAALRARRIEVVTVRPGDTVQSLAARMAFTDLQVDRFVTLNGLEPARPLSPGTQVKLIRWMQ